MYGITPDEYNRMLREQSNLCAICARPFPEPDDKTAPKRFVPHIDHCHVTGKVRGLLCGGCNTALGMFCEDPITMELAIEYVRKHGAG